MISNSYFPVLLLVGVNSTLWHLSVLFVAMFAIVTAAAF